MIHVHVCIDNFQTCCDFDPATYIVIEPALFEQHLRRMIEQCLRQSVTEAKPDPYCCSR